MIAQVRSWFYRRNFFKPTHLPAFVLSVGNISLGGTGKSPFTMLLAERAVAQGLRTAVLTRGYKRVGRELVIVGPNEKLPSVDLLGDEPWMIKQRVPGISLLVHPDRGRRAKENWERLGAPELVILDDGFQHWKLARDRDVVMIDGTEPLHGRTLPLGRMREGADALGRADLVVVTRAEKLAAEERNVLAGQIRANMEKQSPVLWKRSGAAARELVWTDYEFAGFTDLATGTKVKSAGDREFILVTGIAKPLGFRALALSLGLKVREEIHFPDHHRLEPADRKKIQMALQRIPGGNLLMSEKDAARWRQEWSDVPAVSLDVRLRLDPEDSAKLDRFLQEVFTEAKRCSISG